MGAWGSDLGHVVVAITFLYHRVEEKKKKAIQSSGIIQWSLILCCDHPDSDRCFLGILSVAFQDWKTLLSPKLDKVLKEAQRENQHSRSPGHLQPAFQKSIYKFFGCVGLLFSLQK